MKYVYLEESRNLYIKIEQKVFCEYLLDCLDMWTVEIGIECPCSCLSATLSYSVLFRLAQYPRFLN